MRRVGENQPKPREHSQTLPQRPRILSAMMTTRVVILFAPSRWLRTYLTSTSYILIWHFIDTLVRRETRPSLHAPVLFSRSFSGLFCSLISCFEQTNDAFLAMIVIGSFLFELSYQALGSWILSYSHQTNAKNAL